MKYCCHSGLSSPELMVERGHVLRGGVGTEDGVGGVAREEVDQEEGRDRHEDDDDDEQHQPLDDVTGHGAPFPPSLCRFPAPRRPPPAADDPRPQAPCPTMRPMSEEVPALTGRLRIAVGVAVGLAIAAGLFLRFWTRSGLWLDEALTVNIARLPLHDIPDALKHDGAPPLYYYLLHFWMVALRPVQQRRARPLRPLRRAHPSRRLVLRAAPRRPGRGLDDGRARWPARPSRCTTPPSPACTPWSSS